MNAALGPMRAVVRAGGEVRLAQVARPHRRQGWARVRVLVAGICRTDLYAADGSLAVDEPRVLGHELVGEIVEVDPGSALLVGQRVTASPLLRGRDGPGESDGIPAMLGIALDGAFAEEVVLPVSALYPVPRDLELRRAAFVEPLAAALAVLKAPIRSSDRGLLLGAGRIAEVTLRILRARGFDRVEQRTLEETAQLAAGSFDHVIETSATEATLAAALRAVRPGGVVVLKSRPARSVPLDVARAVMNDVTLAAVGYASFREAIALAAELPLEDLLGEIYPLASFAEAFRRARDESASPKLFLEV
jgi:L-iditol 2-dehydrogenase